jgi:RNA polymerase sigma-70 factor (ECF subfamily)
VQCREHALTLAVPPVSSPRDLWSGLRIDRSPPPRPLAGAPRRAPATSEEAVEAASCGDTAGWDWLFNRHHRLVLRYAMGRIGDWAAAEDVTQEVFVAAVDAIGRLRDRTETGVEGWLLGIARNKCIDRIRRMRRERTIPAAQDEVADAGEVVVTRISAAEMRSALELLPADQREVILRRFVLDQSLERVAATTGRSTGAVKSMQHRALASLARLCRGDGR